MSNNIYYTLQGPPNFTRIGIFWSENKPSGNPEMVLVKVATADQRNMRKSITYILV
jgi:hypothetical protein